MDFKELTSKGIVCIDFYADWCGPCKMFAPIFEETAGMMKNVKFEKIDIDAHADIANQLSIRSIPTIHLYQDGVLKASKTGAFSNSGDFAEWINNAIA